MTAINVILRGEEAHVLTDGAVLGPDMALTGIATKVILLPTLPAVVALGGGLNAMLPILASALYFRVQTFDDLIDSIEEIFRTAHAQIAPFVASKGMSDAFELVMAGWSESENGICAYCIGSHELPPALPGAPARAAFALTSTPHGAINPAPSEAAIAAVGWKLPEDSTRFDPAADGLCLLEAQRRTPLPGQRGEVFGVGGYVQHTIVSRKSVRSGIIRRWPDEIGAPIKPCEFSSLEKRE
jgi:hypothetical protein